MYNTVDVIVPLVFLFAHHSVTSLRCPHGARLVNSSALMPPVEKCLLLQISNETSGFKTVYLARLRCKRLGGEIASFENEEIERQALDLLAMTLTPEKLIKRVYIGLNDLAEESNFLWFDNTRVNYFRWGPGEPNNLHESNEDCVVLRTDKGLWRHEKDTEWQDYPCCHSTGIKAVLCQFNQTVDDSHEIKSSRSREGEDKRAHELPRADDLLALRCLEDINECMSNPCDNNGSCIDQLGGYLCHCNKGYTGRQCEELECDPPYDLPATERSGTDRVNGSEVTYTCISGYEIVNKSNVQQIICTDGSWTPDRSSLSTCTAIPSVPCPVVQTWLGVRADRITRYYAGDVINYTCGAGYVFSNDSQPDTYLTSFCSSEGLWTPKLTECKDNTPPLKKMRIPPMEAENAVLVGTVAVIFLICELAVVVLMDVDHLARHLRIMKNNLANGVSRLCP